MKPTEKQIDQADRLQNAGLCQEAVKSVYIDAFSKKIFCIEPKSTHEKMLESGWFTYGPLPTFEEVWPEVEKLMSLKKYTIEMYLDGMNIIHWIESGKHGKIKTIPFKNVTIGAIEALLYLHEAK